MLVVVMSIFIIFATAFSVYFVERRVLIRDLPGFLQLVLPLILYTSYITHTAFLCVLFSVLRIILMIF